jgi:hypothetical protein
MSQKQITNTIVTILSCGPLIAAATWIWAHNKGAFFFLVLQGLLFLGYLRTPWQSRKWKETRHTNAIRKKKADYFLHTIRTIHKLFRLYFVFIALFCLSIVLISRLAPSLLNDAFRDAASDEVFVKRLSQARLTPEPVPASASTGLNPLARDDVGYVAFVERTKTCLQAFPFAQFTEVFLDRAVQPFFQLMWSALILSTMALFGTFLAELIGGTTHEYD